MNNMKLFAILTMLAGSMVGWAEEQSTIYVYRVRQFNASLRKLTVLCDGKEVALLQNGRYFVMKVPAGEHMISDKKLPYNVKLKTEPGREYFVQAGWQIQFTNGHPRFSVTDPQFGKDELKELKLLDKDQVRDPRLVVEPAL